MLYSKTKERCSEAEDINAVKESKTNAGVSAFAEQEATSMLHVY